MVSKRISRFCWEEADAAGERRRGSGGEDNRWESNREGSKGHELEAKLPVRDWFRGVRCPSRTCPISESTQGKDWDELSSALQNDTETAWAQRRTSHRSSLLNPPFKFDCPSPRFFLWCRQVTTNVTSSGPPQCVSALPEGRGIRSIIMVFTFFLTFFVCSSRARFLSGSFPQRKASDPGILFLQRSFTRLG
jgi:hypothetical protein